MPTTEGSFSRGHSWLGPVLWLIAALPVWATNPEVGHDLGPRILHVNASCGACKLMVGESLEVTLTAIFTDGSSGPPPSYSLRPSLKETLEVDGLQVTALRAGDVVLRISVWDGWGGAAAAETAVTILARDPGDLDNDQMSDAWELAHGLNPSFAGDRNKDPDGDLLFNYRELEAGTDPLRYDTDGDRRDDGREIDHDHTDPLVPDADPNAPPGNPLREGCVISALNRSTRVARDGIWVLPNIPSTIGQVRVRATCVEPDGSVRHGQSDFITVPPSGTIEVAAIDFETPVVAPATLILDAPSTLLTTLGQQITLSAQIAYPDGTLEAVAGAPGTSFTTSNAAILAISPAGVATAAGSGRAIVSASYDGATGFFAFTVSLGGDADGDGLPGPSSPDCRSHR